MSPSVAIGYFVLALLPVPVLRLWWVRHSRVPARIESVAELPDVYHLAYLVGGRTRATFAAIAALVHSGRLRVRPDETLTGDLTSIAYVSAMEWAVLDALVQYPDRRAHAVSVVLDKSPTLDRIADELTALGLLAQQHVVARLRNGARTCYGMLILVGFYLMGPLVAADQENTVIGVLVGAGLTVSMLGVVSGFMWRPDSMLTSGGRAVRATKDAWPGSGAEDLVALGGFQRYPDAELGALLVTSGTEPSDGMG